MQNLTCCFTGNRSLPQDAIEHIMLRLNDEVDGLIRRGVTHFLSGGARGFDLIAAALIVSKKEMGNDLRLDFILPCKDQDALWSDRERKLYHGLLTEADGVTYLSDTYRPGCMKRRNRYLVDHANYCIYALLHERGGTWQTVQYSRRKGVRLIGVAE
ncbi:MAG: SLOG family protein [Ethanoligenens sp.]